MTLKPTVILLSIVLILPVLALSQSEMAAGGDWSVKCVEGVDKNRSEIPCDNYSGGNGSYKVIRVLSSNPDIKLARATLTFKRRIRDDSRFLKIISVTPERDKMNEHQDYWFEGAVQGYGGEGLDLIFVTLSMRTHNPKNTENGNNGSIAPGTYTGKMELEDDNTGEKFAFELGVNVRKPASN